VTPLCDNGGMTSGARDHAGAVAAASSVAHDLLDLDRGVLDDDTVHETLTSMELAIAQLRVAAAAMLVEWDQRGVWQNNGSRSPAHRFARETRSSVTTGRAELARARALDKLPHLRQAVLDGLLSWDHVDLFTRACTREREALLVEHEAVLVAQCIGVPFGDAVIHLRYWQVQADEQLAKERDRPDEQESSKLYASKHLDDRLAIQGDLNAIDGEIVKNELDRLIEELRLADMQAGIERTPGERRAAALVEMARRSATAPAGGRRPQPLFTVIVGDKSFEHLCELASGSVLPTGDLVPYLNDAMLESVIFDGPITVVGVSRRRTFTGALRRAIQVRDRRCRHESECDVRADQCDVDHVISWINDGETSQFNGRLECKPHNRFEHLHGGDGTPLPHREITHLDALRARLQWQYWRDVYRNPHLYESDVA
jgi:hypothetical protein